MPSAFLHTTGLIRAILSVVAIVTLLAASLAVPVACGAEEAPAGAPSALYPFCVERRCGLVDSAGNWRVAPHFSRLKRSGEYWVVHRSSRRVGLLDAAGKLRIAPTFTEIGKFSSGLAPAQGTQSENMGFIRADGSWAIEPRYSVAEPFSEGLAFVASKDATTGKYLAEIIDVSGQTTTKLELSARASPSGLRKGLMIVDVGDASGGPRSALINRRGEFIVPPEDGQTIESDPDGSVLVRVGTRYRLIDRKGKTLFEVAGDDASLGLVGEGLAFFSRDDSGTGLVSTRTGAVVVTPNPLWVTGDEFHEGLASVRTRSAPSGELGEGYIDRTGKVKIPPVFTGAGKFHGGIAIVSTRDGDGTIDRSGAWVSKPEKGRQLQESFAFEDADRPPADMPIDAIYETSNAPPRSFPAETAESIPIENLPKKGELLANGRTAIVSVRQHPCGFEMAFNRAGQRIWPDNLIGYCAGKQLANFLRYNEANLSPKAREAYKALKEAEARESADWDEAKGGDPLEGVVAMMTRRLYPEKAERDAELRRLLEKAGWEDSTAVLPLVGPLSLAPNGQWKVLSSDKVAAWREQERRVLATALPLPRAYRDLQDAYEQGKISKEKFLARESSIKRLFPDAFDAPANSGQEGAEELASIPTAFIKDRAERWQVSVRIVDSGHVRLPSSAPSGDDILETLRRYSSRRDNLGGLSTKMKRTSSYSWVSEPRVDAETHMASWAYRYSTFFFDTRDYSSGVVATVALMGRTETALLTTEWQGPFGEAQAQSYFDEIVAVGRSLSFAEGRRYGDYQPADKVATLSIERLITGEPPQSSKEFSRSVTDPIQRERAKAREDQRDTFLQFLIVAAFAIAGLVASRRRRRNRGSI